MDDIKYHATSVREILGLAEEELEFLSEKRDFADAYGYKVPELKLESSDRLRGVWGLLLKACKGNKYFAANMCGCDIDDIEYYLKY